MEKKIGRAGELVFIERREFRASAGFDDETISDCLLSMDGDP